MRRASLRARRRSLACNLPVTGRHRRPLPRARRRASTSPELDIGTVLVVGGAVLVGHRPRPPGCPTFCSNCSRKKFPPRMQRQAAEDLRKLVTDALVEAGLVYEGAKAFATPRRLALTVHGVPARSPDRREERKGPARRRAGEGDRRVPARRPAWPRSTRRRSRRTRRATSTSPSSRSPAGPPTDVIAEIVPEVVRGFPWPKSMRWGAASARVRAASPGCVRSIRSSALFGPETGGHRGRRFRGRRHPPPATSPAATASWRRSRSPSAASTTM